jgi:hypothetical protein
LVAGDTTERERRPEVAALDDVEFTHQLGPYAVFDQRFQLRTPDPAAAALLEELYAAMAVDPADVGHLDGVVDYRFVPPSAGEHGSVFRDDQLLGRGSQPATLLGRLVWAINQQVIKGTPDRLLLHAAAADLDGVGVLVPAKMESGKTTLVTGLLDRGLGYLTDEAASITTGLVLEGYSKPLSIDQGAWEVVPQHEPNDDEVAAYFSTQWQVPAQRISRVVERSRLALIVFRRFEAGTPLRFERLRVAEAVRPMIESTFVTDRPHISAERLREIVTVLEQVPAYELVGGELDDACDAVIRTLRALRDEGRTAQLWDPGTK